MKEKFLKKQKLKFFIVTILFSFIVCGLASNGVNASSIKNIKMNISINADGDAHILEQWETNETKGTEFYVTYNFDNLVKSEISNLKVIDKNGTVFTDVGAWDTSASFSSKSYKSGIHKITGGAELCWGISEYGQNNFTIEYDVTNFVIQYTDTQGIHFRRQPPAVEKIEIAIDSSSIHLSKENSRIWSFGIGNKGNFSFEENGLYFIGNNINSNQYVTLLVRFENNLFNVAYQSSKKFDDVYDEAMAGTSNNQKTSEKNSLDIIDIIFGILGIILYLAFPTIFIYFVIKIIRKTPRNRYEHRKVFLGDRKQILDSITYCREIPCEGNLAVAFWLCQEYELLSYSQLKKGIIGAFFLKWLDERKIEIVENEERLFNIRDNNYAIKFVSEKERINEQYERDLYDIFYDAAGLDKILRPNELKKWCKKHYEKLSDGSSSSWFSTISYDGKAILRKKQLIANEQIEEPLRKGKKITDTEKISEQVTIEAAKIKGLQKFLLEFSSMSEREFTEVAIWKQYLIFAHLLGIADKVESQLSKLYPDIDQKIRTEMNLGSNYDFDLIDSLFDNIYAISVKGSEIGQRRAESSSGSSYDYGGSSSDSGGGGSSYDSGGGSASTSSSCGSR